MKEVRTEGFSFDIEILAFAVRMGYKIIDMPVVLSFSRDRDNHSKIKLKTIFEMIKETLEIRKRVKKYKPL